MDIIQLLNEEITTPDDTPYLNTLHSILNYSFNPTNVENYMIERKKRKNINYK